MSKFNFITTSIEDLFIIDVPIFGDERGFFIEYYNKMAFEQEGIVGDFIQDNHSKSRKGVLRGLHFQVTMPQAKLVRVIKGAVLDVVVDLRKDSKTFGRHYVVELNSDNKRMLYVPRGLAHGFLSVTDEVEFLYKVDNHYNPNDESGIIWNDKTLNIDWQLAKYGLKENDLIISAKDNDLESFESFCKKRLKA